jgi:hypothetical protein
MQKIKKLMTLLIMVLPTFFIAGCGGTNLTDPNTDNTTEEKIQITFVNSSSFTVDPKFFRSGDNETAESLFADPANIYANFYGKTTLPPISTTIVLLPVSTCKTIGTNQAAFSDIKTFTGGVSSDVPILYNGTDFDNSSKITFTFDVVSGVYKTTTSVTK